MGIVQMVIEVCLCLLSQPLSEGGIIYQTGHRPSQCLGIARGHQQAVLLLYHIFSLATVIGDDDRMPLRHVFLRGERTPLLNGGGKDAEVGSSDVGQHRMHKAREDHLVRDAFVCSGLFQMGRVFIAATTHQD